MLRNRRTRFISTVTVCLMVLSVLGMSAVVFAQKKNITVWDFKYGEELTGAAMEQMDKMFMERYPGVKINHIGQSHTEYLEIWTAAASARKGPDVVMLWGGPFFTEFKSSFVPLNDHVSSWKDDVFGWTYMSDNLDPQGTILGVPFTIQSFVMYYNKGLFAKAGLDPAKPPKEWNILLETCDRLKTAGITPIGFGNQDGRNVRYYMSVLLSSVLGVSEIQGFLTGKTKYTDGRVVKAMSMINELYDRDYFNEGGETLPMFMDLVELFMKGDEVAITLGLGSDVFHWKQLGEAIGHDNLGMFPTINYENTKYRDAFCAFAGIGYGITNWCENLNEALDYLQFITSPEAGQVFFDVGGGFPTSLKMDMSKIEIENAKEIFKWLEGYIAPEPTFYISTIARDVMQRNAQMMLLGEMTPEEVCQATQEQIERDLALKR